MACFGVWIEVSCFPQSEVNHQYSIKGAWFPFDSNAKALLICFQRVDVVAKYETKYFYLRFMSWQYLRSYQDEYWHMVVHTHDDFIVLSKWGIRPLKLLPNILLNLQYPDDELSLSNSLEIPQGSLGSPSHHQVGFQSASPEGVLSPSEHTLRLTA